jgi:hypothetical protein
MGKVSDDADEGLGLSLAIYLAAIGAAILVLGTPVYFATKPTQLGNPGMAAYQAPAGTRLVPENRPKADLALDLSDGFNSAATKIARR